MDLPRAGKLLATLSRAERRTLAATLRSSKRKSLHTLYRLLVGVIERDGVFDKEEAFGKLFGRPFSPEEDYLIRNELRLLSARIQDFIAEREYRREIDANEGLRDLMLARGLLERRLFSEFAGMIEKCWQKAHDREDYLNAVRLKDLHYRYLIIHNEISLDVMLEAHEAMRRQLLDIKRVYRCDLTVNQHNRIVCEENLRRMEQPVRRTEVTADTDLAGSDSHFSRFYDSTSRAYQSSGEERLEHARNAVEEIREVAEHFPRHMLLGIAVLASNSLAEGRYQEARASFEECLAFAAAHAMTPRVDIVFNYASTLMRFGEYRMVLDLLERHRAALEAEPRVRFRSECLRCFCHIFLRDPSSALAAIPPNITQRPESEHQYFRFLYLIIPYLNGDLESALRECRNFGDYFTRHKGEVLFAGNKEIVGLFRRFFTVMADTTDRRERAAALAPIVAGIDALLAGSSDPTDNSFYLVWLREEIEMVGTGGTRGREGRGD